MEWPSALGWVDGTLLAVLAAVGMVRGPGAWLVFECLSLAGWLVAWFGAQWAAPQLAHPPAGGLARLGAQPGRGLHRWPSCGAGGVVAAGR
jgi:hypothetical protein